MLQVAGWRVLVAVAGCGLQASCITHHGALHAASWITGSDNAVTVGSGSGQWQWAGLERHTVTGSGCTRAEAARQELTVADKQAVSRHAGKQAQVGSSAAVMRERSVWPRLAGTTTG